MGYCAGHIIIYPLYLIAFFLRKSFQMIYKSVFSYPNIARTIE